MKRTELYKPTNDDWYGNYPTNLVRLTYIGLLTDNTYRVAVWGNDDFGLEKDFIDEGDSIQTFKRLENYPLINKNDLIHLGFRYV